MHSDAPKTTKELRKFGFTMAIAFGIIGGILFWRQKALWIYLAGLAGFFLAGGLVFPKLLAPIEKLWMKLALVLSAIMTRVILTLTYYLMITPIGLMMRLTGKDLLRIKIDRSAK